MLPWAPGGGGKRSSPAGSRTATAAAIRYRRRRGARCRLSSKLASLDIADLKGFVKAFGESEREARCY